MRLLTRTMLAIGGMAVGLISPSLAQGAAGDLYVSSNDAGSTTSTILRLNPAAPGFSAFATTAEGVSFLNFGPNASRPSPPTATASSRPFTELPGTTRSPAGRSPT
jgi:hypothetical protein